MESFVWLQAILIGIGGTLVMDAWVWLQKKLFGVPSLDYALVARWFVLISKGQLIHRPIMATPKVKGEKLLGWILHYLIGIVFAMVLVSLWGEAWLTEPSFIPALFTGIVTLVFPFCVIQPCLGFGVAASKTPNPWKARWFSLLAHSAYGVGLFVSALVVTILF
ncbi:DUF2938 domain-containing protein [Vibrio tapetis subsp. quintayensis]|uniref:DUF2938 domain-containing protein n=1 Tax=Vibrio tapetis TaxID=52443 RepID=UPI0025B2F1E5|nr:DUF2938 domain-containing protein [Vibrio tapetis]MDN3681343.1 DUF2938 domain-containing protein [Vibrio tapetis subsp. quintayensis]